MIDVRKECLKVVDSGYPIAAIAKSVGRDPSTIHKWLKRNGRVSEEIENAVLVRLRELKGIWDKVNV